MSKEIVAPDALRAFKQATAAKTAAKEKRWLAVAMKAQANTDAQAEAERIAARADADVARLRESTERTLREEANRARNELRAEAVQLAVELARGALAKNVNAEDQARLAAELLSTVNPNGEA
jgi:F0F1-type ATP synthase membrane subunit b/b'